MWGLAFLGMSMSLSACGANEPNQHELVRSVNQAYIGARYQWSQGQPSVAMNPVATHMCALMVIQGHFEGGGESVQIDVNADGLWELGGISQQQGVYAEAECVPWTKFTGWTSGTISWGFTATVTNSFTASTPLPPGRCWMTGIRGLLNGGGENAGVGVGTPLEVQTGIQGQYLSASAACVEFRGANGQHLNHLGPFYYWDQGTPPIPADGTDVGFCVIASIAGRFKGSGEFIGSWSSGGSQALGGWSEQIDVFGGFSCFEFAVH